MGDPPRHPAVTRPMIVRPGSDYQGHEGHAAAARLRADALPRSQGRRGQGRVIDEGPETRLWDGMVSGTWHEARRLGR